MNETIDQLLAGPPAGASEAELVDWIGRLESVKCVAEAVQAEASIRLEELARERQAGAGVPARRLGDGVASQVALARRVSPVKGAQLLGLAKILVAEMPHTFALMKTGRFSHWQATIVARETACLSLEDRRVIDHQLCAAGIDGEMPKVVSMGLKQLENAAKRLAISLDQASVVARAANAEKDRRVSLRPAPDTMTWLGGLLPVKDGVAVYTALDQAAKAARTAGDGRTRGQVMADTLVHRVTGRGSIDRDTTGRGSTGRDTTGCDTPGGESVGRESTGCDTPGGESVGRESTGCETGVRPRIEVKVVMTAAALTGDGDEPALVEGYGPVPAAWARDTFVDADVFLRRLFTDPVGRLVAMESRSRKAPEGLAEFIATRDGGVCRTLGCDAPIRNIDHVERHTDGGRTIARNLQGLCERCNQAKEAIGWQARPGPDGSIVTTTPTGHTYTSPPPETWTRPATTPSPPTGTHTRPPLSRAELRLRDILLDHALAA